AEALAGGAGPERVIEGEERGLRRLEGPPAGLAAISLGKPAAARADDLRDTTPTAFAKRRLQRVHEACAVVLAEHETIQHNLQLAAAFEQACDLRGGLHRHIHNLVTNSEPDEAAAHQIPDERGRVLAGFDVDGKQHDGA